MTVRAGWQDQSSGAPALLSRFLHGGDTNEHDAPVNVLHSNATAGVLNSMPIWLTLFVPLLGLGDVFPRRA